jgi:hypothetical protein
VDKAGNFWEEHKRHVQLQGFPQTNTPYDVGSFLIFNSYKINNDLLLFGKV